MKLKFTIEARDDAGNCIVARTEIATDADNACDDVAAAVREQLGRWSKLQQEFQETQG